MNPFTIIKRYYDVDDTKTLAESHLMDLFIKLFSHVRHLFIPVMLKLISKYVSYGIIRQKRGVVEKWYYTLIE